MSGLIKICGIRSAEAAIAAAEAGADLLGFVFFAKSPRALSVEAAEEIVLEVKQASEDEGFALPGFVGLFVDAGEKALAEAAPFLTHFQLHGHEDAERVAEIRDGFGLNVIKAIGVEPAGPLAIPDEMVEAADLLLFDAAAPRGADRPGGNGTPFDWAALRSYAGETPFLLAGGLSPETVAAAIGAARGHTAFAGVDVSSGVEARPGVKDPARIRAFAATARAAFAVP